MPVLRQCGPEGNRSKILILFGEIAHYARGRHVPQLDRLIPTCRGERTPVRAEGNRRDIVGAARLATSSGLSRSEMAVGVCAGAAAALSARAAHKAKGNRVFISLLDAGGRSRVLWPRFPVSCAALARVSSVLGAMANRRRCAARCGYVEGFFIRVHLWFPPPFLSACKACVSFACLFACEHGSCINESDVR